MTSPRVAYLNARLLDPGSGLDTLGALLIEDGKIADLGPDLFKDGAEVVVEGHLEQRHGDTVLVADNVMAKCPSKFQARAEAEASQAL